MLCADPACFDLWAPLLMLVLLLLRQQPVAGNVNSLQLLLLDAVAVGAAAQSSLVGASNRKAEATYKRPSRSLSSGLAYSAHVIIASPRVRDCKHGNLCVEK